MSEGRGLSKFDLRGRGDRLEFFGAAMIWASTQLMELLTSENSQFFWPVQAIVTLAWLLLFVAAIRRLHDAGFSGWFSFVMLLPVLNWIALVVLWLAPPARRRNRYGSRRGRDYHIIG